MPLVPVPSWRRALGSCVAVVLLGLPALAACSSGGDEPRGAGGSAEGSEGAERSEPLRPDVSPPDDETSVVSGGAVETAVATSAALYDGAPVVVRAGGGDPGSQARAASVAVGLGVPL